MIKSHPYLYASSFGIAALMLAACGPGGESSAPAASVNEVATNALPAEASVTVPANAAIEPVAAEVVASPTPEGTRPIKSAMANAIAASPVPVASPATPVAAAPAPVEAPAAFAMCKGCHTTAKGGGPLVGPNLYGVVGSAAGAKPGYAYSTAMKGSNIRWTRANLDAFLADPSGKVPGTKMALPGNKDAAQRKAIVDYLETLK